MKFIKFNISLFLILTSVLCINAQSNIYWVGGSGNWNNVNKWYKDAAGTIPAGITPNSNSIVHFTDQSSTTAVWNVIFQPGSYSVHSIVVETVDDFRLYLNGANANEVTVNVYGDITFLDSHRLEYSSTFELYNTWAFVGANTHDIQTAGLNLFNIELHNENGSFNQLDDLNVSEKIRMFAGTWNSNNYDVTATNLIFADNESSSSPLTKVFNSGTSDITCYNWESGFTYGSLTVTGNHTIRTSRFRGSPKQPSGPSFSYNNIHLLEYSDIPMGTSIIEHNNFECRECIINNITIEDTGDTKLADEFTVNGTFTVINEGSSILFNGGNSRNSEVTFNHEIITPDVLDCDDTLTIFSSIHTDESTFKRTTGTLLIENAVINNIQTGTSNDAVFNLSEGALQGASTGWNIITVPSATSYHWVGPNTGAGDWNEPNNWVTSSGSSNGCIPKIIDDVYIDDNSISDIRIPSSINAECRNFYWTNTDGLELTLDGTITQASSWTISGHFDIDQTAMIAPINAHEIYFSSTTSNYIETRGVQLPEIRFIGSNGTWTLHDNLQCDKITFEAGTFITNDNNLKTDIWDAFQEYPKHFIFGSSYISVEGVMDLAEFETRNITVDPGTSIIECEELNSVVTDLHNVRFINTSPITLNDEPYSFNSLILEGTSQVNTLNDLTLNNLIFKTNDSSLSLEVSDQLIINNEIVSQTTLANPGVLKSNTLGTQVDLLKPTGNLCVTGPVQFSDINADLDGIFNAPAGINGGNNSNIDFTDGNTQTDNVYWVGGSGLWHVKTNWSGTSGGCSGDQSPGLYQNIIFDDNGLSQSGDSILVIGSNPCGHIYFQNTNPVEITINNNISPTDITIDGGNTTLIGNTINIGNNTKLENEGFLISSLINFNTKTLESDDGIMIIKQGSNLTVKP